MTPLLAAAALANLLSIYSDGRVFTETVRDEKTCADAVFVFEHEGRTRAEDLAYHLGIAAWRAKHPCKLGWYQGYNVPKGAPIYQTMSCSLPNGINRVFNRLPKESAWDDGWPTSGGAGEIMGYSICAGPSCPPPKPAVVVTSMKCVLP